MDNDDMSRPVPGEAENLGLHVEMCARRHAQIMREMKLLRRIGMALVVFLAGAFGGGVLTREQILQGLQAVAQVAAMPAPTGIGSDHVARSR
jgi:hypothetical protein